MSRNIKDKVIIITGASSGIGKETALLLGLEGARLVLVARREALLNQIRNQIEKSGAVATCLALDLAQPENIDVMISKTRERCSRIDVLINNAAFGFFGTVENTPSSVVHEIFKLNFEAPLHAIQRVIPVMRRQGNGHIINVSSVAGKRGLPLSGIYCATKFALDGITQSLRLELKDSGIDVSLINPAATESEFPDHVRRADVAGKFKPIGHVQSAQTVARTIVDCIRSPKIEVYPYRVSRALVWLNSMAPSLVDKVMRSYLRDRMQAAAER
jgi:short-subunit dehydrogenase